MQCLVTGANGFLGTNLVRELVAEGWQVRACGRQPTLTRWLADLPVSYAAADITDANWDRPYDRNTAVYPVAVVAENKFWPSVNRIDDVYGDRNLMCSCPAVESYR